MRIVAIIVSLVINFKKQNAQWISKKAAQWAIDEFERLEANRSTINFRGADRRSSSPFITGDGFRDHCQPHICEDANRCRMNPEAVKDGECIFVKSGTDFHFYNIFQPVFSQPFLVLRNIAPDMFEYFVKSVSPRIPGRYRLLSHNGDMSTPDGQDDAPRIGMPRYITSDLLAQEHAAGRLMAHHGQNLWWKNRTFSPRPAYLHCLPIGFENRQYKVGGRLTVYADALRRNIIDKPLLTPEESNKRPLLLVAFYPKSRVPDRFKVLQTIGAIPPRGTPKPTNPFYNETDLSHIEWLDSIGQHRFVLAPFGHGLDTHRVAEIFMMGGIPVMRNSTITSCYDDTDNELNGEKRGSLPMVLLKSWTELTKERLEAEWERLSKIPIDTWDPKRLFLDHWLRRVGPKNAVNVTS